MQAKRWAVLGALPVLVSAAACGAVTPGSEEGAAGGGQGPIRIGVAQPLSGPVAEAGQAVANGAKIAAEEINAAGGIDGRKIELVIEDDANDPATCVNVAQKLINQDQVPVIMGGWGSSCTLAMEPVTSRAQVPLLVETSSSSKITDPDESGNEWTFRMSPTSGQEAAALQSVLAEMDIEKAFFLPVNNDFGLGAAEEFGAVIGELGAENVGSAKYDQGEQSFSSIVTRAIHSGADTWIVTTDVLQIARILEAARGQGADARIITTGGSNSPILLQELVGEDVAEGSYASTFFPFFDPSLAADPEGAKKFIESWEAEGHKYGQIIEGARGYDGINLLAEVFRTVGDPTNREQIRDGLENVRMPGIIFGDIQFQEWNGLINQNVPPVYLTRVEDGEVKLVGAGESY